MDSNVCHDSRFGRGTLLTPKKDGPTRRTEVLVFVPATFDDEDDKKTDINRGIARTLRKSIQENIYGLFEPLGSVIPLTDGFFHLSLEGKVP